MNRDSTSFNNSTVTGNFVQGTVKGNVEAKITSVKTDNSSNQDILELISQLQASVESDSSLNQSDKQEALEEVNKLKEAAKNPKNSNSISSVKSASRMLKGIASELPTAAKFVDGCNKLLPLITKTFGL